MNENQNISKALRGERITTEFSLHSMAKESCQPGYHWWRTIECNDDKDVLECSCCGHQQVTRCDFDADNA